MQVGTRDYLISRGAFSIVMLALLSLHGKVGLFSQSFSDYMLLSYNKLVYSNYFDFSIVLSSYFFLHGTIDGHADLAYTVQKRWSRLP